MDNVQKAQVLNQQFRKVFTSEDTTNLPDIEGESFPSMPEVTMTTPGVVQLLKKLQPRKAVGPDNISAEELELALTCIFQRSIDCRGHPEDWC